MPGRIAVIQQQARELGRLRTGYTEATNSGKRRPVRSDTWIVSSHAEHYVEAAAETWGGRVEKWEPQGGGAAQYRVITEATAMEAILPAGDPLSQSLELWSGGGAARRCDGITEQLTDSPCACLKQFGEKWHEQPKGKVCDPTSRLNVFLPDMPDVGVWRAETKSYYAAQEIAGAVDLIRSTTGGQNPLPIRLRIEHRQRKAGGQTKNFPVIVVELRGINTGQVLTNSVQGVQLVSSAQREAGITGGAAASARQIEAGNGTGTGAGTVSQDEASTLAAIAAETDVAALQELYRDLVRRKLMTDPIKTALTARAAELGNGNAGSSSGKSKARAESKAAPGATRGPDVDALWQQIVAAGGTRGWTSTELEQQFAGFAGVDAGSATSSHMRSYLDHLATQQDSDGGVEEGDPELPVEDPEDYLDATAEDQS